MHRKPPKTRAPQLIPLEKRLMLDASLPAIAGQVLWLDADDATTIRDADGDNAATGTGGANNGFAGTVATWVDKSASGFNVTNATAAQRPTYNATGLNGNGVLTFDGVNDKLTNTGAVIPGNDYTAFVVFNRTTPTARDAVFELGGGGSRNALFINDGSSNRVGYYVNSTFYNSSSTYTAGTYEAVSIVHDISTATVYRNGTSQFSGTTLTRAATTGIFVGDDSSGGDELQGNIAELIVYDRDLSSDERRDIENYLASKWGLTTVNTNPVLAANTGASVSQSDPVTITNAMLNSTDADNTESRLRYTITDVSDYGTLTNTNTSHTYVLGEYFTQGDIDSGYIRYTHGGTANFTDAFSFTVTDQYATTAAATFNLTITPDNIAPDFQGWTLVSSEDFEGGATGWNDNLTETSNPYLTRFLGRHSNEGGLQATYKTYALSGNQEYAIISLDFYRIDSWDTENFNIYIDDALIFSRAFNQTYQSIPDGSNGSVSWTVQESTAFGSNFIYGGWVDQTFRITMRVTTNGAAIKLGFGSTTNQAVSDESWGVDNINIYEVDTGGTPGPFAIVETSTNGAVVGTLTAYDPDGGQSLSYSITGGTGAGIFSVNAATGVVTVSNAAALDYESTTSYTLNVRVTDNGSPSYYDDAVVIVNILDVRENFAPVLGALGPLTVSENAANGTVIGTAAATDADGDTVTYSITAGNTDNIFAINATTGAIRVNSNTNLNFQWDNSYTLQITATDNGFGNLTNARNVVVNLTNVNEAPTFNVPQSFLDQNPYLRYNAATGNFYQYVGTTAAYAAATTAANGLLLNGVSGHIATISNAAENTYVRSLGSGSLWLGGTDVTTEGNWIWDGTGPEGGQVFSIGSAAQPTFYTNWNAGQPDNGTNSDFLEMLASGQWTDVNSGNRAYVVEWEGSAVLAALSNTNPLTLAENPALNQSVGFVHARDPDLADTLSYSVTGGSGAGIFAINASTGEITVTDPSVIDYESTTSYTLDLRVEDAGGLFHTQTLAINITDANDAPDLQGWTLVSSEDFEGGASGWSDNTTETNTFLTRYLGRHSLEGGTQDTFKTYALSGTQDYTILSFDFYRLDSWETEQFRIFIDDTMVFNDTFAAAYKVVADGSLGSVSWTVQEISGAAANIAYASQTDQMMRFTLRIDNNAAGSIKLGFSSNLNSAVGNESWGVDNIDIYEVQDGGIPGAFHVVEGMANGTLVGTLTSSDQDAADTHGYSITGGTGAGIFSINATTGAITLSNTTAVDYETTTSYTLTVRVTDSGTPALYDEETITINVIDRPENNAPVLTPLGTITISENTANGTVIADANATDINGNTITYSIANGNTDNVFSINATTGVIRVNNNANLNREWDASYTLQIRATDNGFGSLYQNRNLVVNIGNVNEAPTFDIPQSFLNENPYLRYNPATGNFYQYVNSSVSNAAANTAATSSILNGVAGHLVTISDAAENAYVRALGGNVIWLGGRDSAAEGQWVWGGTGPEGGQVFSIGSAAQSGFYTNWQGGQPDNGSNSDFLFMQTNGTWADINGGSRRYVIEWEGSDVMAALGNGPYSIAEHTAIGQSVGFTHARDADAGDTITYTITGGTGAGIFNMDAATGEITLASGVNYEAQNSYTLNLRVEDSGGLFNTRTVTINITDQNDAPTMINITGGHIVENRPIGSLVGSFSTVDEDSGDAHIYTMLSDPSGKFTIVGNELRTTGDIDYEQNQSFSITLGVDDGNGGTLNRAFLIQVGDIMDTNSPPPATNPSTPAESYTPPEEEQSSTGNILGASFGGEQGQSLAFYGEDGMQVLRENITFEIRDILGLVDDEERKAYQDLSFINNIGTLLDISEESLPPRDFTNIREALHFLQQMADSGKNGEEATLDPEEESRLETIPHSAIDRQFVDVMTYHQDRAARLREALTG